MKKTPILRQLLLCCFVLLGVMSTVFAQTVVGINGPVNVCQGSTTAYTPATALNPAFNYTWTVSPTASGAVLSGNISGSSIQWTNVGPANVVLTGRKPYGLSAARNRLAFIDEDLRKIPKDTSVSEVFPIASCRYTRLLDWDGTGCMPPAQKKRLCAFVQFAHRQGKKVRLWASPEKESVWRELLDCGVDLINTNKLEKLKAFLLNRNSEPPVLTRTN